MICSQYCSSDRRASAAIASVPYSAIVQLKRPSFSLASRQRIAGRIELWRAMSLAGSTSLSACGSASASMYTRWSACSITPRR
jgi:hypothetical protein